MTINLDQFAGFTPGPWHRSDTGEEVTPFAVFCESARRCIADVRCEPDETTSIPAEVGVNARLIAAAPALLSLARQQQAEIVRLRAALGAMERQITEICPQASTLVYARAALKEQA